MSRTQKLACFSKTILTWSSRFPNTQVKVRFADNHKIKLNQPLIVSDEYISEKSGFVSKSNGR